MAASHFLGKRSLIQPVGAVRQASPGPATARRTVMNQGSEHPLDALLLYLETASPVRLDNFELRQLNVASDLRAKFLALMEQWIDAKALALFTAWARDLARKPEGERRTFPPQEADSLPDDVHELDPFFRTRAESKAIRRRLTVPHWKRWAAYFEEFGCHVCGRKTPNSACGFCPTCYARVRQRFQTVEDDLRVQAAIGR